MNQRGERRTKCSSCHPHPSPPARLAPDDNAVTSIRETLEAALMEYNAANAVMDLVLFDEVIKLVSCYIY